MSVEDQLRAAVKRAVQARWSMVKITNCVWDEIEKLTPRTKGRGS